MSMAGAMVLGTILALARLSLTKAVRWSTTAFVEFFRGLPLVLLIFFCALGLPTYGFDLSVFWYVALGLIVYNGAVLGEIFRAGILSLDRGQTEAAYSLGMGYWQAMLLVVIPQAARRMIPAIVSQLVTLLKDSSLGAAVAFEEAAAARRASTASSSRTCCSRWSWWPCSTSSCASPSACWPAGSRSASAGATRPAPSWYPASAWTWPSSARRPMPPRWDSAT